MGLSSFGQRIVRNTLFNLAARMSSVLAPLLLTPYMIYALGLPLFGVWILIGSIGSYMTLLDMGVGVGLSRSTAQAQAAGDVARLNRLLVTSVIFYAVIGIVLILAICLVAVPLAGLVGIPAGMREQGRWLLIASTVVVAVGQILSIGDAVLTGLQLMDVNSSIILVGTILDIPATVLVLGLGYGLAGLIVKDGLLVVALGAWRFAALWRLQSGLSLHPRHASLRALRELLSFGLRVQVTRIAELTTINIDKLLLGHFVGLQVVGEYEVASRVVRVVKFIALTVTSALMPATAQLQTLGRNGSLLSLYYRTSMYLAVVTIPSTLFMVIAAPNILEAWMGPGYGIGVLFLQALALGHCVHTLTSAGSTIVRGIGRPEVETRYTLLLLVLDVALGVVLIGRFGYAGALVATPLALFVASLYFFVIFHRLLAAPFARLFDVYRLPVLAGLIMAALLWPAWAATWGNLQGEGRLLNAAIVLLAATVYALGYLLILWRGAYLRGADWSPVVSYVLAGGRARLVVPRGENTGSKGQK